MNASTPRVVLCEQEQVEQFEPQVHQVITALLGHSQALVTDESDVGDFMPWPGREDPQTLAPLLALMERPVGMNEKIGDLARELALRQKQANPTLH